jgi:hypothetical protein
MRLDVDASESAEAVRQWMSSPDPAITTYQLRRVVASYSAAGGLSQGRAYTRFRNFGC